MLEGPVEALMERVKLSRKKASILLALIGFILSIPLNLSMSTFDNFTNFITVIISPIGALIVAVVFYYVCGEKKVLEEVNIGAKRKLSNGFIFMGKYVFTITTVIVIILGIIYGGIG